jgi:hypothetical protein
MPHSSDPGETFRLSLRELPNGAIEAACDLWIHQRDTLGLLIAGELASRHPHLLKNPPSPIQ